MQKEDNIRGWLKSINNHQEIAVADEKGFVELGAGDLFGFQINYDTPNNATALFNGNISETYWKTATDNMVRNYGYAYDELNRLLHAQFYKEDGSDDGAYNESLSYDKNGNITNLERWGKIYADAHRIDQLNYTYTGNQLRAVADETNSPQGFLDGNQTANDYEYDANGNLTIDRNKGITGIEYNHLNLPKLITFGGGQSISYLYNALGQKLEKFVSDGLNSSTTEYLSGFQYRKSAKGRRISPSVPVLMYFPTAEGYVNWLAGQPKYVYNYTDHLGNVRLSYTFDEQNNMLKIMEENHYYPFGLKHQNYNSEMLDYTLEDNEVALQTFANQIGDGKYNYKYNGKEFQEELGLNWSDFGFRNYDAALGRWVNVDPLAEKNYNYSTYNYVKNSPLYRFDPNGLTDYTLDRKTGEVKQVGEINNKKPDRILKTNSKGEVKYNKKGEAKVAVDKIESGILKDGQNFKNKDQVISVGGKGEPTVGGVKSFTLQLSEYLGKEIKGFSYSSNASGNVTDMLLGKYESNEFQKSHGTTIELQKKYGTNFSFNNVLQEFHTHPNGELGATQSAPELSDDVKALQNDKPFIPNASFIILYRIAGQIKPEEYDYTHEYTPKK